MGKRKRPRFLKATCWLLLAAIAIPAIALAALNAALATPWACDRVATKIQQQLKLKTQIERISIWPWHGITIHHLQLAQPPELAGKIHDPVLDVQRIHVRPYWKPLLSKQLHIRELVIDQPRIVIAAELVAALMPSEPPPVTQPLLATNRNPTPDNTPAQPLPPAAPSPMAPEQPTTSAPPTQKPASAAAPPLASPPPLPTVWCRLRGGHITLCSANLSQRVEIRGINGNLPLSGDKASSKLRIASLHIGSYHHDQPTVVPLTWKPPQLTLGPVPSTLTGLQVESLAEIGLRRGLPARIQVRCPSQPWHASGLPANAQLKTDRMEVQAIFMGLLTYPSTWQGQLQARSTGTQLHVKQHTSQFDSGSMLATLHSGRFIINDARLTGEDASILGNGSCYADGRYAATLRLVAAPREAQGVAKTLFPDIDTPIPLTPLTTTQRSAFDLEARGNLQQLSLTVGRNGPVIHIQPQTTKP